MTSNHASPHLTVGILHWDTPSALRLTLEVIPSEFAQLRDEGVEAELIVFDNASSEESRSLIADYALAGFRYRPIFHSESVGASRGRSQILDASDATDYVFFLDGNVVLLRHSISLLVSCLAAHPDVTIAGLSHNSREKNTEDFPREVPETRRHPAMFRPYLLPPCHYGLFRKFLFDHVRFEEEGPFARPARGHEDLDLYFQLESKNLHSLRAAPIGYAYFDRQSSVPPEEADELKALLEERQSRIRRKWGTGNLRCRVPFDETAYRREYLVGAEASAEEEIEPGETPPRRAAIGLVLQDSGEATLRCLASIAAHTQDFTIYLFDNNCAEETASRIREFLEEQGVPHLYLKSSIRVETPLAQNTLFSLAVEPYYVCLNDNVLAGEGWCEALLSPFGEGPGVWKVGLAAAADAMAKGADEQRPAAVASTTQADGMEDGCFAVDRRKILEEFTVLFGNARSDSPSEGEVDLSPLSSRICERGGRVVAVPCPVSRIAD